MHPFTVTESRASRRRARRAAIAVVAGLLAIPGTKAFGDPPQPQVEHQHLPGSHANVHYQPTATPVADEGGTGVEWEIPAIIAASVLTAGGLVLTQRRRVGTAA